MPEARPATSASPASVSAPSAASDFRPSRRASASGVASIRSPPPEKNAIGVSMPTPSRRTRSASGNPAPTSSVASTRMAGVRSSRLIREQAHIKARPNRAPKPRSRSSRGGAPSGNVPAMRAICNAALPLGSMVWPASAAGEATSNAAAAVGFAHSTRVASALHSQAGSALVACAANFGSRRYESREPKSFIRVRPPGGAVINSNFVEIVIVPVGTKVHATRGIGAQRSRLTLIVAGAAGG